MRHARSTSTSTDQDAAADAAPGIRPLTARLATAGPPAQVQLQAAEHPAGSLALSPMEQLGCDVLGAVDYAVQRQASGAGPDDAAVHAAAARGVASGATTLPFGDQIQRSFGRHDVSGVQAHLGDAARGATRAMGAEAYATGHHVVFGEAPSLHTAAHEAAHVVQQRAGVHLKGGVGEAGDHHERHADAVADAIVAGRSAEGLLDAYAGGAPSTAVQMYIGIGLAKPHFVKTVDEAWDGIHEEAARDDPFGIVGEIDSREQEVRATLKEWIDSAGEFETNAKEYSRAVLGMQMSAQPAQWRKYRSFYELGIAVAHETHPKTVANKAYEGVLATYVCGDDRINTKLNDVKRLILDTLNNSVEEKLLRAFSSDVDGSAFFSLGKFRGSYRQIGSYDMTLNVTAFLGQLSDAFQVNIAVIHDMMEHLSGPGGGAKFSTALSGTLPDPRDEAYATTLLDQDSDHLELEHRTRMVPKEKKETNEKEKGKEMGGMDDLEIDKKGMKGRINVGTRDVKDIDTITGMVMNAPMLAGKSMTTARMMELVEWAGGGVNEKTAVAWAIFAYWKHLYPASTVPFHTFHEVMDIAMNYGVPYRPFYYPDLDRGDLDYGVVGTKKFNDNVPD